MEAQRMLTAQELAQRFHVSLATVRRLAKSGQLRGRKIGRQWRFDPVVVEKWLSKEAIPLPEGKEENL